MNEPLEHSKCKHSSSSRRRTRRWTFWSDERGMSTVEYILLMVVVVVGCVSVWNEIGTKIFADLQLSQDHLEQLDLTEQGK